MENTKSSDFKSLLREVSMNCERTSSSPIKNFKENLINNLNEKFSLIEELVEKQKINFNKEIESLKKERDYWKAKYENLQIKNLETRLNK